MALRPEELLQIIVGARQARDGVAVEQPWSVAARHLGEVLNGASQPSGQGAMADHGTGQPMQAPPHGAGREAGLVLEDARRLMNPAKGDLHIRPEPGCARQATKDETLQPLQLGTQRPFFATRSRLAATAVRRSLSLSPEAASGGRPSSVMALRTAAQ